MQHDEKFLLPIFINHYAKYVPLNNIFVIDHGSAADLTPPGVNKIYVPRDRPFSEFDRLALIKHISAGLLKYYDYGVYADCDELIALEYLCEDKLKESSVIHVAGFDVYAGKDNKNSSDRLMGLINSNECKPLIFTIVPDWAAGFHFSRRQLPPVKLEIPMAHVRFLFPEEKTARISTRRKVFQSMQENEKKVGHSRHWEDGEAGFNKFTSHTNDLHDKNSTILPFHEIDRDKLFKKVAVTSRAETTLTFYIPKIQQTLPDERYDLTEKFPDLLSNKIFSQI